ncbi:MAG: agmatinase [Actinobacteria bacterium]|nr:agmatinase [Actinomycetota bacterium]
MSDRIMFGPDFTFLGVPRCDLGDPGTLPAGGAVVLGAPFDSGVSYRSGARFGPGAIRAACYLPHDGARPHLALRVDPLTDLPVCDAGDVTMPPGEIHRALAALRGAVTTVLGAGAIPVVLGGDHTTAMADVQALAEHYGAGRISVIHFDAHADTGDVEFGSLYGHGQPFRRLIESGALAGERFVQVGLRGYWPEPQTLAWMARQGIRSFEMAEIGARGLDDVLAEALEVAGRDSDGVFLSVDIDVVDPGTAPGTGTPEPGGLTSRQLLDAVRRIGRDSNLVGMEIVEVAPSYDHSDVTALLANRVVVEALSGVARRRADAVSGTRWDETVPVLSGRSGMGSGMTSGMTQPAAGKPAGKLRVLLVGAGGVGSAIAVTAARRDYLDAMVVADYDLGRAQHCVDRVADGRFVAAQVDATDTDAVAGLLKRYECDVLLNATDPRFVMPLFAAALDCGVHYLDMAMSLSQPHPTDPYHVPGVKLGDEQFAMADAWQKSGRLALVGMGVEPGLSDVFARYAADHLFSRIDEIGVRDGGNLEVEGYTFAPTFSIWTTIEECLNPPVIFEKGRGHFTTAPFSEPEVFDFPEGIGEVECVNVEHEEVLLIPRWVDAGRVTFKYGLGREFIEMLKMQHTLGIDKVEKVQVGDVAVSPRDVIAALLPDPATLGDKMHGKTCAGTWVRGLGTDGEPREIYLYHVVDNDWSMREYGSQAVVWQTAVCPVIALELIANGTWSGAGVLGPEAFPAQPFLDLLAEHGAPWGLREESPRPAV